MIECKGYREEDNLLLVFLLGEMSDFRKMEWFRGIFYFFLYKIVLMFVDFDMLKFLCKCDEVMMEFKKLLWVKY